MLKIDALAHNSALKKTHPGEKLAFTLLSIGFAVALRNIYVSVIILFVNLLLTVIKGKTPLHTYLKLMALPLGFLILALLPILIKFNNFTPTIDFSAIDLAISIALSSLASLSAMYFLALTTPFTSLAGVLHKLYLPELLIELMLLIYRFIFVLMETSFEMTTAQKSRLGYVNLKTGYRSLALLITNLFFFAYKRSEEIFTAMTARNYDGTMMLLTNEEKISAANIVSLILYFGILTAVFYGGI